MQCAGEDLPGSIVQSAFQYSVERGVPLCAFLGDTCATLRMTDELQVSATWHKDNRSPFCLVSNYKCY